LPGTFVFRGRSNPVKDSFDEHDKENQMKKLMSITGAALLAVSLSSAAFAQAGANMNAPQPNSAGTGYVEPGTTRTGTATDARPIGSTTGMGRGMSGNNAELQGNSATSAGGDNSLANTNNPGGMGNNAGPPLR
jgi:hypothetical protein